MFDERYKRAFQRFLDDNPDIDMDEAEAEFNELYNEGLYEINDDYDKAEKIYDEAFNCTDLVEAASLLREAISTCPHHYDSKILLCLLENKDSNDRIPVLEQIREEYKVYLKSINIDIDQPDISLWSILEAKSYIRLLSTLVDECLAVTKYNDARKYAEMEYRLDPQNNVDSLFDYALCVILNEKYELALKLIAGYSEFASRYAVLEFYANLGLGQYKESYKNYKSIYKLNPYYCAFLSGLFDVDQEEIEEILNNGSYNPDSFEESVYYISRIIPLTEKMYKTMDEYLAKYYNNQINTLVSMPDDEIVIITRCMAKNGLTINQINDYLILEHIELETPALKRKLSKLIKKKYLEKFKDSFVISRLSYFIIKAAMSDKEK